MNYTSREELEGTNWLCLIYAEDPLCQSKLERLPIYWKLYYYILHDSDVWDEEDIDLWCKDHKHEECPYQVGEKKKPHYHVIGINKSSCLLGRAATKFDVPSNLVQRPKNLRKSIRYLIHLDHPAKFQYLPEQIITNDPDLETYLKNKKDVTMKAKEIKAFIDSSSIISFSALVDFALEADCYDELRRGQHLFTALLTEHNKNFMKGI